jgi:hyperosmotically inducible protein
MDTYKNGNNLVLLRLEDDLVLEAHKEKKLKPHVAKTVKASGQVKEGKGEVKIESIETIGMVSIPKGEMFKTFDVRNVRGKDQKATWERVRHQLAIMPYWSEFDYISFAMIGNDVILTGWTVRNTNRSTAFNLVKRVEGVERVINNIEVLPMGSFDMDIRAGTRAALQRFLPSYFWGSGSNIKIVVKNGDIILLGTVRTQRDKDVANIQSRAVPGAFHVFNLLQVKSSEKDEG